MKKIFTFTVCIMLSLASLTARGKIISSVSGGGNLSKKIIDDFNCETSGISLTGDFKYIPAGSDLVFKFQIVSGVDFGKEKDVLPPVQNDDTTVGVDVKLLAGLGWSFINTDRNSFGIYGLIGFDSQHFEETVTLTNYYENGYSARIEDLKLTADYSSFLVGIDFDYNFRISRRVGFAAGCCLTMPLFGEVEYELKDNLTGNSQKNKEDIKMGGYCITPRIGISWTL